MIARLLRRVRAIGVTPEALIIVGLLALALYAAAIALIARHDARVIARHEAEQSAEAAERTLNAERRATARDADRREQAQRTEEELAHAQRAAEAADPAGAARAVGPATAAVADELRRQREPRPAR